MSLNAYILAVSKSESDLEPKRIQQLELLSRYIFNKISRERNCGFEFYLYTQFKEKSFWPNMVTNGGRLL